MRTLKLSSKTKPAFPGRLLLVLSLVGLVLAGIFQFFFLPIKVMLMLMHEAK